MLILTALGAPSEGLAGVAVEPNFVTGTINVPLDMPTALTFGPDGRLYVADQPLVQPPQGRILALTLDPATKQVVAVQQIASGLDDVMGLAFDPTALPGSPLKLYASRREQSATDGFESRVSTFTAPAWTRQDVITGLPTSRPFFNHLTNGLDFDEDGRLYIAQGSSTDAGVDFGVYWPETPLSAAVLVADVNAPGFVGAVTYSPAGPPTSDNVNQVSGDVQVFAPGLRNPFDLVIHSNGHIYATDNGPTGPNYSSTCTEGGLGTSSSDELNLVEPGNYYGHPNRNRGRSDPRQCVYRPPEAGSGADYTGPIHILPAHCSCNGIAEYTNDAFGGAMQGDLLIVSWSAGVLYRVVLSPDGRSVLSRTTLASGFGAPLDVAVGPDGTIYMSEFGGGLVSYVAPDSDRDGCADGREGGAAVSLGGQRDPSYFWDFFDVWTGSPLIRDRAVTIGDVAAIVARFGASREPSPAKQAALAEALEPPPPAPAYHAALDRSPPQAGGQVWELGPPDGGITVGDIAAAVAQFGHSCV